METSTDRLAPYAIRADNCRGRRYQEPAPRWRNEFQRDRDRVVHCAAFRRLEYKTQVFVNHEGDMFRTRLTHSLEVAQIARTIARALNVNEDLVEAIALAHDLGHTPFGHAGQNALNACMQEYGGFEHNFHSLRVVESIEARYPAFPGLNLLYETREGILKHCSHVRAKQLGELGRRFIEHRQPSLEAQIANVADEIAYNHHDIDDGLRAGLLEIDQLRQFPLFNRTEQAVATRWPHLDSKRVRYTVIREMLDTFVSDLITATQARVLNLEVVSVEQVRQQSVPLITFSTPIAREHRQLKRLLRHNLYEHARVIAMAERSRVIVRDLFEAYMNSPISALGGAADAGTQHHAHVVADYIAGMTDRFAIAEHARITTQALVTA
ncbi:MAG: deoxyguanosinetriphosphate triphosphohydrolase [Gammaproteobacteria bacterium]